MDRVLGRFVRTVHPKISVNLQASSINRRTTKVYSEIRRVNAVIPPAVEHYKKNSAENISDELAIDAFNNGLRRTDFVEELGRVRPKTIGNLMDLANKWTNGKDATSNK
jgi:hypothetical protein